MDPNAAYRNLMQAVSDYEDNRGDAEGPEIDAADEMRDAIRALDDWLSKKGFLPDVWARGDVPSETLEAVMSADDAYNLYEGIEDGVEDMSLVLKDGRTVSISGPKD